MDSGVVVDCFRFGIAPVRVRKFFVIIIGRRVQYLQAFSLLVLILAVLSGRKVVPACIFCRETCVLKHEKIF